MTRTCISRNQLPPHSSSIIKGILREISDDGLLCQEIKARTNCMHPLTPLSSSLTTLHHHLSYPKAGKIKRSRYPIILMGQYAALAKCISSETGWSSFQKPKQQTSCLLFIEQKWILWSSCLRLQSETFLGAGQACLGLPWPAEPTSMGCRSPGLPRRTYLG